MERRVYESLLKQKRSLTDAEDDQTNFNQLSLQASILPALLGMSSISWVFPDVSS